MLDHFPGDYLLKILFEVGPTETDGDTEKHISWTEFRNYCLMMQLELAPWEARAVVDCSRAYLRAKMLASRDALTMQPVEAPSGFCGTWMEDED